MVSTAWEAAWAKPRNWHFILQPTKSTNAVEQNVTGGPMEEEDTGFRGRGGEARDATLVIRGLCCVSEPAGMS